MESAIQLPFQTVLSTATPKTALFDIRITDPRKAHRFDYLWDHTIGDFRTAKHDESTVYLLPYGHGSKHFVPQGYHGTFSHSGPGLEFAIDFTMPVGTPVHAARSGMVANIKETSDRGGVSESYRRDGNLISVLHEDGSIAEYVHLQKDGVLVDIGDQVAAGEKIGLSGNTGQSSGPHLHFHVALPTATGKIKTLSTKFLNHNQEAVFLEPGETYYSFHPGKPHFETVFGKDITNADYDQYSEVIPAENRISIREEVIDDTILLFVRNGFDVAKEFELILPELHNLNVSKPLPLTVTIEPETERFLLFLRQNESRDPYKYTSKWEYRDAK